MVGTSGEKAVISIGTKPRGVFYCFLQSHLHAESLQPTGAEMQQGLSGKIKSPEEKALEYKFLSSFHGLPYPQLVMVFDF